jgi:hypothetical protein
VMALRRDYCMTLKSYAKRQSCPKQLRGLHRAVFLPAV